MEEKKYLNEEKYQKVNNTIKSKGKLITNIGLGVGLSLIIIGVIILVSNNSSKNNVKEESEKITQQLEEKLEQKEKELETEKNNLKNDLTTIENELNTKKQELLNKGIVASHDYNNGESYDLYILDNALDPGFKSHYCAFDQYNKNELTKDYCTLTNLINGDDYYYSCEDNEVIKDYCSIKDEITNLNKEINDNKFNNVTTSHKTTRSSFIHIPLIMIGFFITVASLMGKLMLFSITHRREIAAYTAQQIMPVAKEGIEEMAPTAGSVAKEIAKGIKEGLEDEEK